MAVFGYDLRRTTRRGRPPRAPLLRPRLSGAAIVVGKLAARWLQVVGVLLTGLPVLCLMQCWGGLDLGLLLAGCAAAALTALSLTALSLFCSVREPTVPLAVLVTYLIAAIFCAATTFL